MALLDKKTKIVATLGPATQDKDTLREMLNAGVNVFRINFSHADYDQITQLVNTIRDLNKKYSYNAALLGDLQGPKLRVGVMKKGVQVTKGQLIDFVTGEPFEGDEHQVYMNYASFPCDVKNGERILLDDGKLIFEVVSTNKEDRVTAKVIQGGKLRSKKGVNLPNTDISLPALTQKDIKDATFACKLGVDWMALSFVRNAQDIRDLQQLIERECDHFIPIIAKIEKPEGVDNIDQIIKSCNGLMVARGDLGVEVPAHDVPLIQKQLVLKAKKARIPVIIATQMMESMIDGLTPTRAEVNDVANSVMDGADAVMLSGETAVGKHPVAVIQTMTRIIKGVENSDLIRVPQSPPQNKNDRYVTKSVCYHAAMIANEMEAQGICTLTNSGYTAFQISAWRPTAEIFVFTSNQYLLNRLSLLWGVKAFYYDSFISTDDTVDDINNFILSKGYITKGSTVINLAAMPIADKGMVNTLRVSKL